MPLSLPVENLAGVLQVSPVASDATVRQTPEALITSALEHPIGTARLCELAKGKRRITIITSDHTRAVPSDITLPLLLQEIRKDNPTVDITIIVATGLHRGMTHAEMIAKFGEKLVHEERIINHDAFDSANLTNLGTLPSGSRCEINRMAIDTDLLVAEGFIEPHFFAGFSGGRKSVLPGIASQACVNINHSAKAIQDPKAITGVLEGNPIHEDMAVAARLAKLAFILNVLLDEEKNVVKAYAGDFNAAHRAGCDYLLHASGVDAIPADIVITTNGGYPLDQNLYQCPKGLSSALATAKKGAVIILVAACRDGLGGENFGRMMQEGSPDELMQRILAQKPEETISEQWCVQRFAQALQEHPIILVSDHLPQALVEKMNFIYADTMEKAMAKAFELQGEAAGVTVIPDGVSVIVRSV
ncbi:MAG: lactate racemization operon protein LarA [Spirochaetae bacterium HGW-Spirochaetae-8]|nr:MAG: lactate racemization operon protein LarA [Spirochaetae bacterium HGW-Spirochaetae-8]